MSQTITTVDRQNNYDELYSPRPGLKVPFNYDIELLDHLGRINKDPETVYPVTEVYGCEPYSIVGSGRAGDTLSKGTHAMPDIISRAHKNGIKFNYLLNAISMGGAEWDTNVQKRIFTNIKGLVEAGLDCVTVTLPYLIIKIKEWFPELEVSSSVNNHLSSVEKVRQMITHTGVDRIMLDHGKSRNFPLIRAIHKEFPNYPIVVLVNESCLPDCVLQHHHQDYLCQTSRKGYKPGSDLDFCHILCAKTKLSDPVYTLKAPWVRPEDIHHLIDAGATYIKLAGRTKDNQWILAIAEAYAKGRYVGDIWKFFEKSGLASPDWGSRLNKKLTPCHYHLQNEKLDGFITPFVKGTVPCVQAGNGCGNCQWCNKHIDAVSYPTDGKKRLLDIEHLLSKIRKDNDQLDRKEMLIS